MRCVACTRLHDGPLALHATCVQVLAHLPCLLPHLPCLFAHQPSVSVDVPKLSPSAQCVHLLSTFIFIVCYLRTAEDCGELRTARRAAILQLLAQRQQILRQCAGIRKAWGCSGQAAMGGLLESLPSFAGSRARGYLQVPGKVEGGRQECGMQGVFKSLFAESGLSVRENGCLIYAEGQI